MSVGASGAGVSVGTVLDAGRDRKNASAQLAPGSTSTSRAFASRVSGMARIAPSGPISQVQRNSVRNVMVTDNPTASPMKRGWISDCTTKFSTE